MGKALFIFGFVRTAVMVQIVRIIGMIEATGNYNAHYPTGRSRGKLRMVRYSVSSRLLECAQI